MPDGGGFFGDPLTDIFPVAAPLVDNGFNPIQVAEAAFAPAQIVNNDPGIIGPGSQIADSIAGAEFGGEFVGPALSGLGTVAGTSVGAAVGSAAGAAGATTVDSLGTGHSFGDALTSGVETGAGSLLTSGLSAGANALGVGGTAPGLTTPSGAAAGSASAGGASALGAGVGDSGAGLSSIGDLGNVDLTSLSDTGNFSGGGNLDFTGNLNAAAGGSGGAGTSLNQGFNLGSSAGAGATSDSVFTANALGVGGVPAGQTPSGTSIVGGQDASSLGQLSNGQNISTPGGPSIEKAGLLQQLGIPSSITDSLSKNPVGSAISGAGLLYNLIKGSGASTDTSRLQQQADAIAQQGNQLSQYLQSGQLPPGAAAAISNATQAAKAAIRSRYAANGQSNSSAEVQELNQVDMNAAAQTFSLADTLLQQGISETGLSTQIYEQLLGLDQKQNASTGSAIASFAAALNGGSGNGNGVTLKLAG